MSSEYKARQQSWDLQKRFAHAEHDSDCLLELLSRIKTLERGTVQLVTPATEKSSAAAPAGSLVDDVAECITPSGEPLRRGWACDAITEAADWLEKRGNVGSAEDLRREAAAWLEAELET